MPARIFGARFYGYRRPAWHSVGQVSTDSIGAIEAFERLGPYDVELEASEAGAFEITRLPTKDDPRRRGFGKVGDEYELISPNELTAAWDASVSRPVETMGALDRGECLFLTLRLDAFDVVGDAVENYLVVAHWMTPNKTSAAFISPVRVVCSNTLRVAERLSRLRVDLLPRAGLRERLGSSLQQALHQAPVGSVLLRRQLEFMARRGVTPAEARSVVAAAYPDDDGSLRDAALELFNGAGSGMDHLAARGTAWGLYNAIAEVENFREGGSDADVATEVLFGARKTAMQEGFKAAMALCRTDGPHELARSVGERSGILATAG